MGMRFEKIELKNFGPYQGNQILEFGLKKPIVVIHGENMAGKTSLLNAIRWVLYGHALNRFGKPIPLKQLVNIESSEVDRWVMSAELRFSVNDVSYELERLLQPKYSVLFPHNDADFEVKTFLKKDGRHLNTEDAQKEINRIFPEQIARFFLFDGELLNEYESLLMNADKQAAIIKESIEHILGVPALVNALIDLKTPLQEAYQRQKNLAKQDKDAKKYTDQKETIDNDLNNCEKDLKDLKEQQKDLYQQQKELDERLQAIAGAEADVQRLQEIEGQAKKLKDERQRLLQENCDKLSTAWRDLVQPIIRSRIQTLGGEITKQTDNLNRRGQLLSQIRHIEHLLESNECPVCGQKTDGGRQAEFLSQKHSLEEDLRNLEVDQQHLAQVSESLQKLSAIKPSNTLALVASNEKRLISINIDLTSSELKIDEINERLKGHDKSEIIRNRADHTKVTKELIELEKVISEKDNKVRDLKLQAKQVSLMIREVSGPRMQRSNREVQLCEDLVALFEASIIHLRDDLRKSVEREATFLFLQLTTDKSYQGLRINDNYGLTILDAKGRDVPIRSAGAEQIVALSLIGALNRNAIRQGPIVMDTPFGRLDQKHRENILKFLPTMSDQVIILVHGGEIDRERDLQHIKDQVDKEYFIVHHSSYYSELVARTF